MLDAARDNDEFAFREFNCFITKFDAKISLDG